MWLLAFVPVYLIAALLIARFCRLNTRLDETMSDYFSVLEAERRAEAALDRARQQLVRSRSEVAEVRLASEDDRSISRSNGVIGTSMAIIPQSKANVLAISDLVEKRLEEVQLTLPKDMTAEINIDNGIFIAASLKNVLFALSETLILVLVVIFLFLGTLRATLIPAVDYIQAMRKELHRMGDHLAHMMHETSPFKRDQQLRWYHRHVISALDSAKPQCQEQ